MQLLHQHSTVPATGPTVLVMGQDLATIAQTMQLLQRRGHQVLTSTSAVETFALLQKDPSISSVVVDFELPGVDCAGMINWLRSLRPDIPIVLAASSNYPRSLLQDGTVVLLKPYHFDDLDAAIEIGCPGSEKH